MTTGNYYGRNAGQCSILYSWPHINQENAHLPEGALGMHSSNLDECIIIVQMRVIRVLLFWSRNRIGFEGMCELCGMC